MAIACSLRGELRRIDAAGLLLLRQEHLVTFPFFLPPLYQVAPPRSIRHSILVLVRHKVRPRQAARSSHAHAVQLVFSRSSCAAC